MTNCRNSGIWSAEREGGDAGSDQPALALVQGALALQVLFNDEAQRVAPEEGSDGRWDADLFTGPEAGAPVQDLAVIGRDRIKLPIRQDRIRQPLERLFVQRREQLGQEMGLHAYTDDPLVI